MNSQRLMLRGDEESINLLRETLCQVKDKGGISSGTALLLAFKDWESQRSTKKVYISKHRCRGSMTMLQLPLMFSSVVEQGELNSYLDIIRRDGSLLSALKEGQVPREQWLLESLNVLLAQFLGSATLANSSTIQSSDGLKVRKLGCGAAADHHAQPGVREAAVAAAGGKPAASEESVGFSIPGGRRVSVGQSGDMAKSPKKKSGWRKMMKEFELENREIESKSRFPVTGSSSARNSVEPDNSFGVSSSLAQITSGGGSSSGHSGRPRRKSVRDVQASLADKNCHVAKKLRDKYRLEAELYPGLGVAEGRQLAKDLAFYLSEVPPETRNLPGYAGCKSKWERHGLGLDCDEVWPGIFLGNGATVKKLDYLREIGVTAVLNAAEFRGVNVGAEYYRDFDYLGVRIEDTPQTQISRHFLDAVDFIDTVLVQGGKVFVNCVFGRSRSATFVAVYLMLKNDWSALKALKHIRQYRPVQLNDGFLRQVASLNYRLNLAIQNNKDMETKSNTFNLTTITPMIPTGATTAAITVAANTVMKFGEQRRGSAARRRSPSPPSSFPTAARRSSTRICPGGGMWRWGGGGVCDYESTSSSEMDSEPER